MKCGWNRRPGEGKEHSIWVPLRAEGCMHVISCRPGTAPWKGPPRPRSTRQGTWAQAGERFAQGCPWGGQPAGEAAAHPEPTLPRVLLPPRECQRPSDPKNVRSSWHPPRGTLPPAESLWVKAPSAAWTGAPGGLAAHCPAVSRRPSSRRNQPTPWFPPCGPWRWTPSRT